MNYMNKKGQGSDTFKLLIAAVVAMVILGIVTGVFQSIWALVGGITCVSNPIDEMVTKIKKAQSGITTSTGIICMYTDESYTATALTNKVTNLNSIEFKCDGAAVCKNNKPIDVSASNMIEAKADAQFKGIISCTESSGDYDCTITIKSA